MKRKQRTVKKKMAGWGEKNFLQHLQHRVKPGRGVALGIGDDCAGLDLGLKRGEVALASCDALVENVHFSRSYCTAADIGWKLAAVNISDIAAMGGRPRFLMASGALPGDLSAAYARQMLAGIQRCCRAYGVTLVGGDTTGSPAGIFLSGTVIGTVDRKKMVRRTGARPGDILCLISKSGLSALALDGLRRGRAVSRALRQKHLRPRPLLAEGQWCAASGLVRSLTDLSDSLREEVENLTVAYGLGARLDLAALPSSGFFKGLSDARRWQYQLDGGEDFALLAVVAATAYRRFAAAYPRQLVPATAIGEVTSTRRVELVAAGRRINLRKGYYKHFVD